MLKKFIYLLVFLGINTVGTLYAEKNDSLLAIKNYKIADSLLNVNSDSSTYYFIKSFKHSYVAYIENNYCEKELFASLEKLNEYFLLHHRQELFIKIIRKFLSHQRNCSLKTMFFKIVLESNNNFLNNKSNVIFLKKAIEEIKKKCNNELAKLVLSLGNYYYNQYNLVKALKFYQIAYNILKQTSDKVGLSKVLNNIAIIHIELRNFNQAESNLLESLKYKKENNDERGKAFVYNNLSMIYSEKAIFFYDKNIDSSRFYKDKALYYSNLSIKIDSMYNNISGVMTSLLNEASLLIDLSEYFKAKEKYDIIKKYLKTNSRDIEIKLYYLINSSELDVIMADEASLSEKQRKYYLLTAKEKLLEAIKLCKQYNYESYFKEVYSQLYSLSKTLGEYEEALKYYEIYQSIKDSLLNTEKQNYVNFLDKKFQANQQKEKIKFLEKEKYWLNKQRKIILIFGIVLVLLLLIIINQVYKRLRITRRQNYIIAEQKRKIEKIHQELIQKTAIIEQSILYTKNIQESFLVESTELQKYFNQVFIIFKPKDVLSGDFYFFREINGIYYFALGDCAGHGIPGAVMSFVATALLMQILSENKELETNEVLLLLHKNLLDFQTQRTEDLTESIEISLVKINKLNKTLTISSTNQEVYLFINNELIVVEPDIQSIGQLINKEINDNINFSVKAFSYENNGCKLILATDGFYDEYNTVVKKRYGKKQFKEFLERRQNYLLSKIYEDILIEYEKWNNKSYQVDDISIIGLEIS